VPLIRRTALVGVGIAGRQIPVLCYETSPGLGHAGRAGIVGLEERLREAAVRHPHTAGISYFLRHPGFPVDVRHNAKIGREKLADWAAATASPSLRESMQAGRDP